MMSRALGSVCGGSFARRVAELAAVALVCVSLVGGCTESQEGGGGSGSGSARPSGSPSPRVRNVDMTTTVGDPKELQVPGSDRDTVTVGVVGLEVDGEMQVLSLVFTPHFESRAGNDTVSLSDMLGSSTFSPRLIDRKNLEIYIPLDASTTSSSDLTTGNGQPLYVFAVFAAPQDGAVNFDLQIDDSWTSLPVSAEKK